VTRPTFANTWSLVRRTVPAGGTCPDLELIEVRAHGDGVGRAPLLCIHGAFAGAWMWEPFLHHIGCCGRSAAALSFRGHGQSGGAALLREARLSHYIADVMRVIGQLDEPPVVVGHSLGALIAQQLLSRVRIRALVLLAPLPPEGMLFSTLRLLAGEPALSWRLIGSLQSTTFADFEPLEQLVFSKRSSPGDVARYAARMVQEPMTVLLNAHVPQPTVSAYLLGTPTLVVGADRDRLVPFDVAMRTAIYHGGEHVMVQGHGHLMHLEGGAEEIVGLVMRWLSAATL
jgi:pimeloyl-ACP methyl ester carboxylesterase